MMHELVAIAGVPGVASMEYKRSLEAYYKSKMDAAVAEHTSAKRKVDSKSVPWEIASKVMASAEAQMKRLARVR